MKDQLYMLRPGFFNGDAGPLYCPDCAALEGVLGYFPQLRQLIDVHYLDFKKPRARLVTELGESFQSLPVLILASGRTLESNSSTTRTANGRYFIDSQREIRSYLSSQYQLPRASD